VVPLKICAVVIVAVAMDMALAHALELPGKLRLSKEQYLAVQAIYYPGFTFAGVSEPLSVILTALLAFLMPAASLSFWLTLGACVALVLMHAIYWVLIQPVNSFWLKDIGVRTVSLADTVGTAPAPYVGALYHAVKNCVAGIDLGVHLHSRPEDGAAKILAAYDAGCRRFDGALTGLGGCPFAGDDLVGNIATETIISALTSKGVETGLRADALEQAIAMTHEIRTSYGHEVHTQ